MGLGLFLLARLYLSQWPWHLILALAFIFLELLVITAVATLFSSFTTPTLSAIFTLSIFFIGHLSADLKVFGARFGGPISQFFIDFLYYLLPNLRHFHFEHLLVHRLPVNGIVVFQAASYGFLYGIAVLLLAMLLFVQRDLK
jgi:hypothetical protein